MKRPATIFEREVALSRLGGKVFDVVVLGGGITGAGVALDAASRGLSVALVERGDFASGTSSKSSKMVHGGLRYLHQHEFGLVRQSLRERRLLLQNAPHLVEPLAFLIPLFGKGAVVEQSYSTALWAYDLAGGRRIRKRHRRVGVEEVASHFPTLRTDRVAGGFVYYDAWADDARLTLAILRTAVLDHGAVAVNYAPAVGLARDAASRVTVVKIAPVAQPRSGTPPAMAPGPSAGEDILEIKAKIVVNATGVWADGVQRLDDASHQNSMRPAKGVHITVPRDKLPCDIAALLQVPNDRRSVFVIPWGEHTYVGTTDTDYDGPLDDVRVEADDITYLLDAVNAVVMSPLRPKDVRACWAGLRPLLAKTGKRRRAPSARTADLSRCHTVQRSTSGLISVTGGKLTTYRQMAADTVDAVQRELGSTVVRSRTEHLRLRGSERLSPDRARELADEIGITEDVLEHVQCRYGADTPAVLGLCLDRPELGEGLAEGFPNIAAEVVYAARFEMATCVDDVLARRTRALLLDARSAATAARRTAELLAAELGWDDCRVREETEAFARITLRGMEATSRCATN
jgi:glycerol-3-phosphate dehydrogenase